MDNTVYRYGDIKDKYNRGGLILDNGASIAFDQRLLDAHLDDALTREEYLGRKERLLHEKADIKENLSKVSSGVSLWLEPDPRGWKTALPMTFPFLNMRTDPIIADFCVVVNSSCKRHLPK